MFIQHFVCPPLETNSYLLSCSKTAQAVIIDPSTHSYDQILRFSQENSLHLTEVWLTHSHWDHIVDVIHFQKVENLPVFVHVLDVPNLTHPGADGLPSISPITGCTPNGLLEDGMLKEVGFLKWQVIHTPGHSPGSICFYCREENVLISGDTLFKGTIGNISFPTSQPDHMWQSLKRLALLPPETKVYPGHGPATSIGQEKWLSRAQELFRHF